MWFVYMIPDSCCFFVVVPTNCSCILLAIIFVLGCNFNNLVSVFVFHTGRQVSPRVQSKLLSLCAVRLRSTSAAFRHPCRRSPSWPTSPTSARPSPPSSGLVIDVRRRVRYSGATLPSARCVRHPLQTQPRTTVSDKHRRVSEIDEEGKWSQSERTWERSRRLWTGCSTMAFRRRQRASVRRGGLKKCRTRSQTRSPSHRPYIQEASSIRWRPAYLSTSCHRSVEGVYLLRAE